MSTNTKLNAESFIGLVKQSNLVDPDLLKKTWRELQERALDPDDARGIADELVARNVLTRWQADKLLQRKHKGFFLGKYRLLSHLGSGGMSAVYLAEHVLMRRRVAIKVLPQTRVNDSSYLQRFHREAQAVAALDHRNIVRAYDVDQEGKVHFLVMEFVAGQSLHDLTVKQRRLDCVPAVEYIRQAAEGLQHAHRMGMVHRDIKPGNLLLDEKGTVKLLDLGLARFFNDSEEASLTIQHDERVLGTADFLSPEQALDSHKVDVRSDIYSLGCTLYFMLAGRPPFPEGTLAQRLLAHQTKQPDSLRGIRPDVPDSLIAIVERMMAKKPEERFQSARETADALLLWLMENGGEAWTGMNPVIPGGGSAGAASSGSGVLESDTVSHAQKKGSSPTEIRPGSGTGSDAGQSGAGRLPQGRAPAAGGSSPRADRAGSEWDQYRIVVSDESKGSEPRPGRSGKARREPSAPQSAADAPARTREVPDEETPTIRLPGGGTSPPFEESAPVIVWSPPRSPEGASAGAAPSNVIDAASFPEESAGAAPRARSTSAGAPTAVKMSKGAASGSRTGRPAGEKRPAGSTAAAVPPAQPPRFDRRVIAGGAAGLFLLLAAIGYFSWHGSAESGNDWEEKAGASTGEAEGAEKRASRGAPLRRELSVGPGEQFASIAAALEDTKKHVNKSRKAVQIIRVAAGRTYPERIVIDGTFPRGIQIVAREGTPPVIAPPDSGPIVVLRGGKEQVENFLLEGFQLDATNKEIGIQLADWVPGARLKRLDIRGFTRAGILIDGAQTFGAESSRIVLEKLTVREGAPGAAGVLFQRKADEPAHVRIAQCRFLGPLAAGVEINSGVIDLELLESIFFRTRVGVRLAGGDFNLRDLLVAFNSFYENERGIVFSQMPGASSSGLGFHNNLFVGSLIADTVVEQGFDLERFLAISGSTPGGAAFNWTTRSRGEAATAGELAHLFEADRGRFGATDLGFHSTDPQNPGFLAPTTDSPHRSAGTALDRKRFGDQVGAVRGR